MVPGALLYPASAAFDLTFSPDANLTCVAQYTYDETTQAQVQAALARAGTALTITIPNHCLNVGDTCDIQSLLGIGGTALQGNSAGAQTNLDVAGITDHNNFTVTVPNAGIAADTGFVRIYRLFSHATLTGTGTPPARVNALLGVPAAAVRLHVSAYTAGIARLSGQQTLGS